MSLVHIKAWKALLKSIMTTTAINNWYHSKRQIQQVPLWKLWSKSFPYICFFESVVMKVLLTLLFSVTCFPLDLIPYTILRTWHWPTILSPCLRLSVIWYRGTIPHWAVSPPGTTITRLVRNKKIFFPLYSSGEILVILHDFFKHLCKKTWPDPLQTELGHLVL